MSAVEEVVWPSRVRQIAELLGDAAALALRPGDVLPPGYALSYGSMQDRGRFRSGGSWRWTESSVFRIGEPIVTECRQIDGAFAGLLSSGLRGIRTRLEPTAAITPDASEWQAAGEVALADLNVPALNVQFGHLAPIYFADQDMASRARIGEFVLLALLLSRAAPGWRRFDVTLSAPVSCRNRSLLIAETGSGHYRIGGDQDGVLHLSRAAD